MPSIGSTMLLDMSFNTNHIRRKLVRGHYRDIGVFFACKTEQHNKLKSMYLFDDLPVCEMGHFCAEFLRKHQPDQTLLEHFPLQCHYVLHLQIITIMSLNIFYMLNILGNHLPKCFLIY